MRGKALRTALACALVLGAQVPGNADKPEGYLRIPVVIGPGAQAIPVAFWVDANDSVAFALRSQRRDHRLVYTDPSGQEWETVAPSLDALESWNPPDSALLPDGPGALYHLLVNQPVSGCWTLTVRAEVPTTEPLLTQLLVFYRNSVAASMTAPKTTLVGGTPLAVTLVLIDGSSKRKNLQITTTLNQEDDPDSLPASVRFFDDGTHEDPIANDGSYTALVPTGIPGKFHLEAKVEGSASTGQCQRSCGLDFKVVAQAAKLTGNIVQRQQAGVPE